MSSTSGLNTAVVAEKPSVARDIARVLGSSKKGDGYLHGGGYVVTWALGHLVELAEPEAINPAWKSWRRDQLPMVPAEWPLVIQSKTRSQFQTVQKILTSRRIGGVICATDAGREGELIFRYIYEKAGSRLPVERLWISSLTPDAIAQGLAALQSGSAWDDLADAAKARSRADWLVGMNLTRAYTIAGRNGRDGELWSVGRVQTPTLALIAERELEIRRFVPDDYHEVVATFAPEPAPNETYRGTYFAEEKGDDGEPRRNRRLAGDGELAQRIAARAKTGEARIESIEKQRKRMAPPLFYDLAELQRHANRLFGLSAKRTLETAQKLYEQYKLITYPRTDSRHISRDVAATLSKTVAAVGTPYEAKLAPGTGTKPLTKRYVDDKKVTDHHAILPTGRTADLPSGSPEAKLYDLICRRLLMAWQPEHIWDVTNVVTAIGGDVAGEAFEDRYASSGKAVVQAGWKALDIELARRRKKDDDEEDQALPAVLAEGQAQAVEDAEAVKKQTRPPKRFTEASLLTAMESAGKTLDDKELSDAMKERGLGTPATRAAIIETLLSRGYIERQKKSLVATEKGIALIERVHPSVRSPAMTGEWEFRLKRMERGEERLDKFLGEIEEYVREVVGEVGTAPTQAVAAVATAAEAPGEDQGHWSSLLDEEPPPPDDEPPPDDGAPSADEFGGAPPKRPPRELGGLAGRPLDDLLHEVLGFAGFRPYQREVCEAVAQHEDVLLVMPTGAGKSLCYQLPALHLGGTTLVVSPLIALMEDQVAKLQEAGIPAERIHSGLGGSHATEVLEAYDAGKLALLYVSPERLAMPRFFDRVAARAPSLIAIDEAHCISQWGHDFRPEYRKLGERLPKLGEIPLIALTATATPAVQEDICHQLRREGVQRMIRGFRRHNLAVEVNEIPPGSRPAAVRALLANPERRPAIVYAPSRKMTEALAEELRQEFRAAAYHAGMAPQLRDSVQRRFVTGECEVIIATIAFGMGVDKANVRTVVHTALPSSVEGYYQEIGRAGRDGQPSRAVLYYSWADRHQHEFFFGRDYPDLGVLARVFEALGDAPVRRDDIEARLALDEVTAEKAIEKLWIHQGVHVDAEDNLTRGTDSWRGPYLRQRNHKQGQLEDMIQYARRQRCRMVQLVEYFGDQTDALEPCGHCDVCAPQDTVALEMRKPTGVEQRVLDEIVEELIRRDGRTTGQLFREVVEPAGLDRKDFDNLIVGMERAGIVSTFEDSFEKEGRTIGFRRATLDPKARELEPPLHQHVTLPATPPKTKKPRAAKRGKTGPRKGGGKAEEFNLTAGQSSTFELLRVWRTAEAKKQGLPPFRILSNATLKALAASKPRNEEELLHVRGIGPALARRYGRKLLQLLHS